jgi:hypothetical protein
MIKNRVFSSWNWLIIKYQLIFYLKTFFFTNNILSILMKIDLFIAEYSLNLVSHEFYNQDN